MKLALTEAERNQLRALQKQRRDTEGYVTVTVVPLLDAGWGAGQVAQALGLDDGMGYRYAQAWQRLGLETYLVHETRGYRGLLPSGGLAALSQEVEQTLYADVRALGMWLKHYWGVNYSVSGLTQLLHRLGCSYKLTTPVPYEATPARQATFLVEQLRPLLAQAEAGQAVVYFVHAAHPTYNAHSTRVCTRTGQTRPLPTVSGRERVNLNTAVNAHYPTQVHLHETNCVNAQSTKTLHKKLLAAHPQGQRIYVICDNARYYRNRELAEWLRDKPLVQIFLPSYSPNLNLIERLWEFLRQKIINPCFYPTKGAFRQAVPGFFDRLDEFGHELASLLTLNFHLFES